MSGTTTWFFDESYQLPNQLDKYSFYVFGGVQILNSKLEQFEEDLKLMVGAGYWNTTEAIRTRNGTEKYFEIAEYIRAHAVTFCFSVHPLDASDKLGESSRAQLIRKILFESEPHTRLIFEARPRGFQMDSDLRILKELRQKFVQFQSRKVEFARTREVTALWAADVVAYAARQSLVGKPHLSYEALFK